MGEIRTPLEDARTNALHRAKWHAVPSLHACASQRGPVSSALAMTSFRQLLATHRSALVLDRDSVAGREEDILRRVLQQRFVCD